MSHIETPQSRCKVALLSCDITPPVGMYHRMWGAALHDRSTGIHRPLQASLLYAESLSGDPAERMAIVSVDHCILDESEIATITARACEASGLRPEQFHVTLSHTHGAGWMSRSRAHLPGGNSIGPYLNSMTGKIVELARQAVRQVQPVTVVHGQGRCPLAVHRDFWDKQTRQFVCGFNPGGPADDTLMVARFVGDSGKTVGTLVNYACHPTTLAWQNTVVSPDYPGAMREVIEQATHSPCLFLQGASGDLGPREGYVGETDIADKNGRQLGYAALSTLESLPPPGTQFVYKGPVISGAILGTWAHEPVEAQLRETHSRWRSERFTVDLPYRLDLPDKEATIRLRDHYLQEETAARNVGNTEQVRDARAKVEQMNRQLNRLEVLPEGKAYPYPVTLWQVGTVVWVLVPGELYQYFQTALRRRFPQMALIVVTLTGGWQPAYLPVAAAYGYGIYQDIIAAVGPGSLETLVEAIARQLQQWT